MASSKEYLEFILGQLSDLEEVDNKEFLTGWFHAIYEELPTPKTKKKK